MGGTAASFGYWVRRRRLALDLTREALARRVGCSPSAIKKIERDERRPSRTMANRLAEALGLPADQRARFVAAAVGDVSAGRLSQAKHRDLDPAPAWLVRTPAAQQRPAVGRDSEVAWLQSHLSEVLSGGGRVVFVIGEAGMGKTALMTAFVDHASREVPDLVVARGAATAVGAIGDPYFPVRDAFRMLLADHDAPLQADQLTREQAARLWDFSATAAGAIVESGPRLLDVLVPVETVSERLRMNVAAPARADPMQSDVSDDVTKVLRVLASRRPLLLVLDDMQWSDTASAELLFHLVRTLADTRVLVVCAFRSSDVADASGSAAGVLRKAMLESSRAIGDSIIDLDAIDSAAERALCDALLDLEAPDLDQSVHDQFYRRTNGHPLAVVELVRELKARGDLVRLSGSSWAVRPGVNWNRVPARVAAVIEQRLDRLDGDERALLTAAAVEGEYFTAEVAARVAGMDLWDAHRLLGERLGRVHGLVREESVKRLYGRPVSRYRFGHALFQNFVLDLLNAGARSHAHGLVAAELETLHSGDLEPVIPLLAHHYAEAGDVDKAVPYLIRTGDRARLLQACEEALAAYDRALGLLREQGDTERMARALMRIGMTHEMTFDHQSAQRAFDRAFALWPAADESSSGGAVGSTTLRLVTAAPQRLDPHLDWGGAPAGAILFSGLVQYDEGANIVPDVAERWEISSDGRRYSFHLRNDVAWSDGQPVTAHDFVTSYQRIIELATGAKSLSALLMPVTGARDVRDGRIPADQVSIHAVDDRILVIELDEPTSFFMYNLANPMLVPMPRHLVQMHGSDWCRPDVVVSNGPFQLTNREPGSMTFERNPHYHGVISGNVQRLRLKFTEPGDDCHERLYQADEVDALLPALGTNFPVFSRLRDQFPREYVTGGAGYTTYFYWVDHESPPMDDQRLRQAMALAVNRDALARAWGQTAPAYGGLVPPGIPGHLRGIAAERDPDRAARLITDLVGDDTPPIAVIGFDFAEPFVQQLVNDWRAVGLPVDMQLCATAFDQSVAWRTTAGPKVAVHGWLADYPDPDTFLRVAVEGFAPGWRPAGYGSLLERAARTSDLASRLQLYREAEEILAEEAVLVPLLYHPDVLMLKPWVTKFPTVPFLYYAGSFKDVVIGTQEA